MILTVIMSGTELVIVILKEVYSETNKGKKRNGRSFTIYLPVGLL